MRRHHNKKSTDNHAKTNTNSLQATLTEFTVNYMIEQPDDIVKYAVEYFRKLQNDRKKINHVEFTSSEDENHKITSKEQLHLSKRRRSYFSESYNPNDENLSEILESSSYPKTDEVRMRLREAVQHVFIFRILDENQLKQVIDAMFERIVVPNEIIFEQNSDADYFYVIESGRYIVYENDKVVHLFDNAGSFGEQALIYNIPRETTIKSVTVGKLWAVDRSTFRRIVVKLASQKRQFYEDLLKNVVILKLLRSSERSALADALTSQSYSDGEIIFHTGDTALGMYFVEKGMVSLKVMPQNGVYREIVTFGKGTYFGELALVSQRKRRQSTAFAVGDVKLAFLDTYAFERLLGPCVDVLKRKVEHFNNQVDGILNEIDSDLVSVVIKTKLCSERHNKKIHY